MPAANGKRFSLVDSAAVVSTDSSLYSTPSLYSSYPDN